MNAIELHTIHKRMHKAQRRTYTGTACVLAVLLASCAQPLQRPFVISGARIVRGTGSCYKVAGIEFAVYNGSTSYIATMQVYARLYVVSTEGSGSGAKTSYTAVPSAANNEITQSVAVSIAGKEQGTVCISLDGMLVSLPTEKLLAKPFYIEQVTYDSGAVWKDAHGVYRHGIAE